MSDKPNLRRIGEGTNMRAWRGGGGGDLHRIALWVLGLARP